MIDELRALRCEDLGEETVALDFEEAQVLDIEEAQVIEDIRIIEPLQFRGRFQRLELVAC
jgi:hypothetical protein